MLGDQQLKTAVSSLKKEANYLLGTSKTTSRVSCLLFKEIINKALLLIGEVFVDPEFICTRFVFGNLEFRTENFKITHYKLSQAISVESKNDAKIEVFYLKPETNKTEHNKKFYSEKEASLVKLVAKIIEDMIKQTLLGEIWEKDVVKDIKERQDSLVHHLHFEATIDEFIQEMTAMSPEKIDSGIHNLLHVLRNFLHVERCFLFLFNEDGRSAHCAYQDNMKGVKPLEETLLEATMPDLFELIKSGKSLRASNQDDLPEGFELEKKIWKKQGVESLMFVAIMKEGKGIGFLGFKSIKGMRDWVESDLVSLLALGKTLAYVLLEKDIYLERKIHVSKIETMAMEMLEALSLAIEKRDPYTAGHQKRTATLAVAIAKELGLSETQVKNIYFGATIHDIGKIHIPAEILNYSGELSDAEMALIKTHPQLGFDIIKNIKFLGPIGEIVLNHHERLNGSGYPHGLRAKDISLECRIVTVADVVEAMTSHRPYRLAHGLNEALAEISTNKGKLYDVAAVDACINLFEKKRFAFKDVPFICKGNYDDNFRNTDK